MRLRRRKVRDWCAYGTTGVCSASLCPHGGSEGPLLWKRAARAASSTRDINCRLSSDITPIYRRLGPDGVMSLPCEVTGGEEATGSD